MSSDRQPKYRQEIQQVSGPVSGYSIPFVNKVNASVSVLELVVSLVFEYWSSARLSSSAIDSNMIECAFESTS